MIESFPKTKNNLENNTNEIKISLNKLQGEISHNENYDQDPPFSEKSYPMEESFYKDLKNAGIEGVGRIDRDREGKLKGIFTTTKDKIKGDLSKIHPKLKNINNVGNVIFDNGNIVSLSSNSPLSLEGDLSIFHPRLKGVSNINHIGLYEKTWIGISESNKSIEKIDPRFKNIKNIRTIKLKGEKISFISGPTKFDIDGDLGVFDEKLKGIKGIESVEFEDGDLINITFNFGEKLVKIDPRLTGIVGIGHISFKNGEISSLSADGHRLEGDLSKFHPHLQGVYNIKSLSLYDDGSISVRASNSGELQGGIIDNLPEFQDFSKIYSIDLNNDGSIKVYGMDSNNNRINKIIQGKKDKKSQDKKSSIFKRRNKG